MQVRACSWIGRIFFACVLGLAALLVAGCQGSVWQMIPTPLPTFTPEGASLPMATIRQGLFFSEQYYTAKQPAIVVVARPEEIVQIEQWLDDEILAGLKSIDYEKQLVIVVFQGAGPSDRNAEVKVVARSGSIVTVVAYFNEPPKGAPRELTLASPYHIVAVEKVGEWDATFTFRLVVQGEVVAETTQFVP